MSLRVCICMPDAYQWFVRCVLSRCEKLSGIEWLQANTEDQEDLSSKLQSSDVVVSVPSVLGGQLHNLSRVKWVHNIWAGVKEFTKCSSPLPFILTRHVGSYGLLAAEYTLAQIINRERHLFTARQNQLQLKWDKTPWSHSRERLLSSLSIGILGVGAIGSKIAEICKSFGMTVWGVTRSEPVAKSPHVDHYRLVDGLPEVLSNSDYVCSILPSTSLTAGLLEGDILKSCSRKRSVLISIGRGDVVSESALVRAIREGWLGGAVLDVFEEEPLPQNSELWRMPEVVITPHIAAPCTEECADVFVSNLQLFVEGRQLNHTVELSQGY